MPSASIWKRNIACRHSWVVRRPERAETRRLVQWFDEKFYDEVSRPILFEKVYRRLMQCGGPDSDMIRLAKESLLYHVEYLTELLTTRHWLAGETISLADISAAAHLSALDFLGDVAWNQADGIREWYALVKSRPSFRSLLLDKVRGFHPPLLLCRSGFLGAWPSNGGFAPYFML